MSYTLQSIDVEKYQPHEEYGIPSKEYRSTLRKGDFAKLLFLLSEKRSDGIWGEYLWVEIDRCLAGGRYKGRLKNKPLFVRGVGNGNAIELGPENVFEIGWKNKVNITPLEDDILIEPLTTSRRGRPPKKK